MANESYCEVKAKKEYTEQVRRWNNDTEASGSEMGADIEKLLNNDAFLKKTIENMQLSDNYITVPANKWSGTTAPYTMDITVPGATADSTVIVAEPPDITDDLYMMLADAAIVAVEQGEGIVRLKARGTKPASDLQLRFLVSEGSVIV